MHAERGLHRHVLIAFVFCLLMSYVAETFFGVADITGAFIAGVVISSTQRTKFLASKFDVLSYAYLSPIFFASIGLKVSLPSMNSTVILFSASLVLVAILTKVIGCGIGARLRGYTNEECVRIGVGMISRGEVALIVASKGEALGLLGSTFLGTCGAGGHYHHYCNACISKAGLPQRSQPHDSGGRGLLKCI
ncbi:Kef-type K+ transport systems, membrane components [butyrate-producing bacterium SM4/1]|nr:Kef-type K+ transport systems, membrane components [butyrate-producing bacterium SM4/1]